jgi:CRISPR/Cas system endoribonuclease Cas6 (RAMP superfamily)
MSRKSKEEILQVILYEAKAKQGTEAQACVELTASTKLAPLIVDKSRLVGDVAKTLEAKYAVTFPNDLNRFITIDDAAQYIVDNMDP